MPGSRVFVIRHCKPAFSGAVCSVDKVDASAGGRGNGKCHIAVSEHSIDKSKIAEADHAVGNATRNDVLELVYGVTLVNLSGDQCIYNDKTAEVTEFDSESQRCILSVYDFEHDDICPDSLTVLSANMILPIGTCAKVTGLKKGKEYNGQWGLVVSFDQAAGRYLLQMDSATQLMVKLENGTLYDRTPGQDEYEKGEDCFARAKYKQAASLYEQAAQVGHRQSQFSLASMYDQDTIPGGKVKAAEWFGAAAAQGCPRSQVAGVNKPVSIQTKL